MADENDKMRDTDDDARAQARRLVSSSRYGSLAVILPQDGSPFASRTAVANDIDRTPVILVSDLSKHSAGLFEDGRVSLLLGEPGKGDPLAHPRITLQCKAEAIRNGDERKTRIRARFLRRHPKAELYVDFGDFVFFRLNPVAATLIAGFGKAYNLKPDDFLIASDANAALANVETRAVEHMNKDHSDAIAVYARVLAGQKTGKWILSAIDAAGFELISGDRLERIEFDDTLQDASRLAPTLAELARTARENQG
ncbi:MAG: DUF2470 domain-containing protein [Pseudomonadota bacterium]